MNRGRIGNRRGSCENRRRAGGWDGNGELEEMRGGPMRLVAAIYSFVNLVSVAIIAKDAWTDPEIENRRNTACRILSYTSRLGALRCY
jgi:hypothetical protein